MVDLLVFAPACLALNLSFGPSNLLALTHGARRGPAFAFTASIGRLLTFIPMIALSGLGLGLVLATSALAFTVIKLIGAAYLIWLGYKLLRTSQSALAEPLPLASDSIGSAFRKEALVAVGNPKAILIFAAFLPQFVDQSNYALSYLVLGGLFLLLEMLAILTYASIGKLAANLASSRLHWFQRGSGIGMIVFGILLLFARRPGMA